ncbi:hypothetical protein [Streptomyces sp. NPDC057677]|uniref:hypothetical protein n=1 Tax=unclassified Streptomyces TaxID=2593676 RepID=UPI0036C25775
MDIPTSYGIELAVGDELGVGVAPECCDDEMDPKQKHGDLQWFWCCDCRTVLIVDGNGLVWDIQ